MPTINQLVRQGRTKSTYKSKSPALLKRFDSLNKKETNQDSAQKRGVCTRVGKKKPKKPYLISNSSSIYISISSLSESNF